MACRSDAEYARELAHEKDMVMRGSRRYFRQIDMVKARGMESKTRYGLALLRKNIEPYAVAIGDFIEVSKSKGAGKRHLALRILRKFNGDMRTVAFIALRVIVDTLSRGDSRVVKVATRIGSELDFELMMREFEAADSSRFGKIKKGLQRQKHRERLMRDMVFFAGQLLPGRGRIDKIEAMHVGMKMIDIAIEATGLVRLVKVKFYRAGKKDFRYELRMHPDMETWLHKYNERCAFLSPVYLPTLIEPLDWTGVFDGGYHHEEMPLLPFVKTRDRKYLNMLQRDYAKHGKLDAVFDAVNRIQRTKWRTNRRVLDVAIHIWDKTDGDMAGLPPRDALPLPPCPVCGADITDTANAGMRHACFEGRAFDDPVLRGWKESARSVRDRNASDTMKRLRVSRTIHVAERMLDYPCYYFPSQIDFRGRVYPLPTFLNPQGTDLAKGLLEFAEGKRLGTEEAVRWLMIHGANCYGIDKTNFDGRVEWVKNNESAILACAEDPIGNRFWMDADKPFCFLAFCYEWQGYREQGLEFESRLPIAMDGTCNGLQLYSLLLRDEVGGAATNIVPSDMPQDIYGIVAAKVVAMLEKEDDAEKKELAQAFLDANIDRKTTKRQVMVLPYGGTFMSCIEYTQKWIKEAMEDKDCRLVLPVGVTVRKASLYLAKFVWIAIHETVVKAREGMAFLQKMASICSGQNEGIFWITPSGFPVWQWYENIKNKRVKTMLGESVIHFTISEKSGELDKPGQRLAIAPNYIHSLDAAALVLTINNCPKRINAFAMIHDSYGTHAADTQELAETLRKTFVEIFGDENINLLALFRDHVLAHMKSKGKVVDANTVPNLPEQGGLDIGKLAESRYFFA